VQTENGAHLERVQSAVGLLGPFDGVGSLSGRVSRGWWMAKVDGQFKPVASAGGLGKWPGQVGEHGVCSLGRSTGRAGAEGELEVPDGSVRVTLELRGVDAATSGGKIVREGESFFRVSDVRHGWTVDQGAYVLSAVLCLATANSVSVSLVRRCH
jgi:hypothetical protein